MWKNQEGRAETVIDFLKEVNDDILNEHEWVVSKIEESYHKDAFVNDGTIDDLVEEKY